MSIDARLRRLEARRLARASAPPAQAWHPVSEADVQAEYSAFVLAMIDSGYLYREGERWQLAESARDVPWARGVARRLNGEVDNEPRETARAG